MSDITANTARRDPGEPSRSSSISSRLTSSRTWGMAKGSMRVLHETRIDLRVLPAASLNIL